jgi:hypothetical protein
MKVFRSKIVIILLLPVLLFSLSGAGLHLHYCNSKSQLLTHFHLGKNTSLNTCCGKSISAPCCGFHNSGVYQFDNDIKCCTDVYSEAKTDKDYQNQSYSQTFSAVVTEFPYFRSAADNDIKLSYTNPIADLSPPELLSTVVLLI